MPNSLIYKHIHSGLDHKFFNFITALSLIQITYVICACGRLLKVKSTPRMFYGYRRKYIYCVERQHVKAKIRISYEQCLYNENSLMLT